MKTQPKKRNQSGTSQPAKLARVGSTRLLCPVTFEQGTIDECVCGLDVWAGTNCPKGGDRGHGGRTIIRIANPEADNLIVTQRNGEVEIEVRGDIECRAMIRALRWLARGLKTAYAVNSAIAWHTEKGEPR